jgi:hypothetical protein
MTEQTDPVELSESRIHAFVDIVGELLYYGSIVVVPTVLLAIPIHWVLTDAYMGLATGALGPAAASLRPFLSGFLFLVALVTAGLGVRGFLTR